MAASRNYIVFGGSHGIGETLVAMLRAQNARVSYSSREDGGQPASQAARRFAFDAARGEVPPDVDHAGADGQLLGGVPLEGQVLMGTLADPPVVLGGPGHQ